MRVRNHICKRRVQQQGGRSQDSQQQFHVCAFVVLQRKTQNYHHPPSSWINMVLVLASKLTSPEICGSRPIGCRQWCRFGKISFAYGILLKLRLTIDTELEQLLIDADLPCGLAFAAISLKCHDFTRGFREGGKTDVCI